MEKHECKAIAWRNKWMSTYNMEKLMMYSYNMEKQMNVWNMEKPECITWMEKLMNVQL